MNYAYYGTGGVMKMLYEDIDTVRMDYGLVILLRKNKAHIVIRLGDGERLVRDDS